VHIKVHFDNRQRFNHVNGFSQKDQQGTIDRPIG